MERNDMLTLLASDYMEKLFYFCLKKTGKQEEAEDLSQEIALCVLKELHRGVVPENFQGYVWQIARNRYAHWAEKTQKKRRYIHEADIGELDIAGEATLTEDYIREEDKHTLRRELAFIASEYREIILAYYIEDNSVKTIAEKLSIPEGTVKIRLFRARNRLKEGMNMARTFGKRSYKPENMHFVMSGITGKAGEPFSLTNDLLSKNILLSAYDEPQPAEEIAIETGVALPYVQERLEILTAGTLMKKTGNRYATKFYIVSSDVQKKQTAVTAGKAKDLRKRSAKDILYITTQKTKRENACSALIFRFKDTGETRLF